MSMRHVGIVLVVMSLLVIVGCKQPAKGPQTTVAEPPVQSLEPIPPAEPNAMTPPAATVTPPPAGPTGLEKITPAAAEPAPAPRTYTVQKGDTLWSISVRMLGSGKRWREIADLNPGLEPTKLRVGQVINLPPQ